jgi:exopolyphosphatase/guanosine-5'-triphosphate,3'-diphosphate pyrophosphatase
MRDGPGPTEPRAPGPTPRAQTSGKAAAKPQTGGGVRRPSRPKAEPNDLLAALDLGSNNCRLLIAAPSEDGFRVVDGYSRIVRLGEGVAERGELSEAAMERAAAALSICADKIRRRGVRRVRAIATQACRAARNGQAFLDKVKADTGLALDVISPREEARLSVLGCIGLIDRQSDAALVVDIGGGSTELSWVDVRELSRREAMSPDTGPRAPIVAWTSIPIGVVSLAEAFPELADRAAWYAAMRAHVRRVLTTPEAAEILRPAFASGRGHLIGTSGTVTSIAGVHLRLPRYERARIDGLWVTREQAASASRRLQTMCRDTRAAEPCIGPDRADLVLAGCAILEEISDAWPAERLRVADRGLREGLLMTLMNPPRRRRRRGKRR